ncbi:hypothetical protein GGI22_001465 [Coemansia erecta]|nr:hypothetical protein GGI22_001465 [Coemansia erecta]
MENQALLDQATGIYNQAVQETPPNRTKLDALADFLNSNPKLLYHGFFEKGHEAVTAVINVFVVDGMASQDDDENLLILTPPAVWGWAVLELAVCSVPPKELYDTSYPGYVTEFFELAKRTIVAMEATPMVVVRRAIQALTRFWPVLLGFCIDPQNDMLKWKPAFDSMILLGDLLSQFSESSDDPALQMHLVKFLETEAAMFTSAPPNGQPRFLSLSDVPTTHPYVSKQALAKRGDTAMLQLLRLLPNSDSIKLCNTSFITALINSIVYLMNLRPQFCQELAEKLTDWYAVINSSEQVMTHSQLVIIGKTIRISLLQLYGRLHMGEYGNVLENTLDRLGGPEWASWQERQAKDRERRERQRGREQGSASRSVLARTDDVEIADIPPQPQTPSHTNKRQGDIITIDDDDDEDKQLQLMEENVKRIRIEEAKAQKDASKGVATATASQPGGAQQSMDVDNEMVKDVRAAVEVGKFDIKPLEGLSSDERQTQLNNAMNRIATGASAIRKFITDCRLNAYGHTFSLQAPLSNAVINRQPLLQEPLPAAVMKNGMSTNYGVLEDVALILVRSVADFYIMANDVADLEGKSLEEMAGDKWSELHASVNHVLESIVDAPRELYSLAITLLYEMWMAVLVTDPDMKRTPDKSGCEYSVLSLYLKWCEEILAAVVRDSIEATASQQTVQVVPEDTSNNNSNTAQDSGSSTVPADHQAQQQIKLDHLILTFILEAPYIPPKSVEKIEVCLKTPGAAALGFVTLEKAMELRAPIMKPCLDVLLTYSVHPDRAIRVGCIRAVKRYYTTSEQSQLIEKYALASMKRGMEAASATGRTMEANMKAIVDQPIETPVGGENDTGGSEGANAIEKKRALLMEVRKKGEKDISDSLLSHVELPLALCTRKLNLLLELFAEYAHAPLPVQIEIRKIITPLIKSMAATPEKIVPVLQQFPAGAETVVLRIIAILCTEGQHVPSKELVQGVIEMCEKRSLGAEFVVFLVNGMDKTCLLQWLSPIVGLLEKKDNASLGLVGESFKRMTTSSSPGKPSVLSPTELLLALHNNVDMALVDKGCASSAVNVFEALRRPDGNHVFETAVMEAGLKLLQEQSDVPPLLLFTAELYHQKRGGSAGMVIGLLGKLIERKVWEMNDHVIKAFIWCFAALQPGSLGLIKNIPSDGLKRLMEKAPPTLWTPVRDYVSKMPENSRKALGWLFA